MYPDQDSGTAAGEARQRSQETAEVIAEVERMRMNVLGSASEYHPGEFWDDLIARNIAMLEASGIENFKRTIANNYYNWMVSSIHDPQIQRAITNWLRHPSLRPLAAQMRGGVREIRTLDRSGSYSFSRFQSLKYKMFVAAIWETARRLDSRSLTNILSEPPQGNPLSVKTQGREISQDLANSIVELSYVDSVRPLRAGDRIAELGAGYGRLADVFLKTTSVTYCVFDIPPALAVAQWYLRKIHGNDRVIAFDPTMTFKELVDRLVPGVVAFFSPSQLELFPDGWFDVTQTISTLPEMPRRQSDHYLKLLAQKSGDVVYLKQWIRWRNDRDQVELREADYNLGPGWALAARREDPIQPQFFNQVWRRKRS